MKDCLRGRKLLQKQMMLSQVVHNYTQLHLKYITITNTETAYDPKQELYTYKVEVQEEHARKYVEQFTNSPLDIFTTDDLKNLFRTHALNGTISISAKDYTVKTLEWNATPEQPASSPVITVRIQFTKDFTPIIVPDIP